VRARFICVAALFALGLSNSTWAETFNWSPGNSSTDNLNDLDHYMAITWRISGVNVPTGQTITGAKLTITNIRNWQPSSTDKLFINLLDTAKVITPYNRPTNTTLTDSFGVTYTADLTFPSQIVDYFDNTSNTKVVRESTSRMSLAEPNPPFDASGVGMTYMLDFANVPNALATLQTFVANGNDFAFGFDPDCHYFNTGLTFSLTTSPASVPEPTSIVLLGTMAAIVMHKLRKRSVV
jgi:hypothetical protein